MKTPFAASTWGARALPLLVAALLLAPACTTSAETAKVDLARFPPPRLDLPVVPKAGHQKLVLAGGCFWCTEAVFEQIPGVVRVVSGYAGGRKGDASYEIVSAGGTNHAESVEITYDPAKVSYGTLLEVFFAVAHDPTQLNRQGPDWGRQYRSAIFYATPDEKRVAEAYIRQLTEAKVFPQPIVTTLEKLDAFYPAEAYHQGYVAQHPTAPYVVANSLPKVARAKELAAHLPAPPAPSK